MSWHYEQMVGDWVKGRCVIRDSLGKKMPNEVKNWLNDMNKATGDVDPHEDATSGVRTWLVKTIDDPDWG